MSYTIAVIEDVQGTIKVDFGKSSNQYIVSIWETELRESTCKCYKTQEEAYSIFEKLSKAIITGCFSYEQRKAMLA